MHYGFISTQYLPTAGGVERYTWNLARRLAAQGHHVTVVTSALHGLPAHEIDADGIEIYRLPSFPVMHGRLPVIRKNAQFRTLAAQLWADRFDFCVINTYFYPLCLYAARQTKRRGIPAICVNHGSAWLMTGNPILAWAGRVYERCAAGYLQKNCGRFYGVSQAACEWLSTFGLSAKGILTNAVDPAEVRQTAALGEPNWRSRLGLSADAPLIAFVGRMIPEKGVDTLAGALPEIRRAVPGAALVLAGGGPMLADIRGRGTEGLFAVGELAYADSLSLLAQADVFCLPTRSEGFACTVLEAAALRCPIITTATGGSPQLLQNEQYGLLLPDRTPEKTAAACIRALQNPAWRRNAAENTAKQLEENYTWNRAVAALEAICKGGKTT
ncbi:MAG: glycosyltransferase family 4 protein [Faecalibacterium sp.]|jgi:glycosyltransferase involved in cell wall biosynthesis|nr:glycosyltransferase family 4 protein [Faecalibacterium sp.]